MVTSEQVSFRDRVAVVTGAGRGLGRAYALELGRRGAKVVVNDLPLEDGPDPAQVVVDEILAEGGTASAASVSVGTSVGGQAVIDHAVERFGPVDVVINNAGPLRFSRFAEMSDDYLDAVIDVHLKGAFYVTRPVWASMMARGYGRIVMTSSNAGVLGMDASSNYAAAKGGIMGLTRSLALEGAPCGIKVNAIMPAATTSPRVGSSTRVGSDTERIAKAFAPLADRMTAEHNAALVTVLASEHCPTTGQTYSSVAGRYARVAPRVARGWLSGERLATPEEVLAHFDEIHDLEEFEVVESAAEELESVAARVSPSLAAR